MAYALLEYQSLGYLELKRIIESKKYLDCRSNSRPIPWDTYEKSICALEDSGIISPRPPKDERLRGKKFQLSLTTKARRKLRLGILVTPGSSADSEQDRRKKLLLMILYFAAEHNRPTREFHPSDKQELNEYLTGVLLNCFCSIDKLKEMGNAPQDLPNTVTTVYESPSACLLIWKDKIYPSTYASQGANAHIPRYNRSAKHATIYYLKTLGVSAIDVLYRKDRPFFKDIDFTYDEVERCSKVLVDLMLMEEIGTLHGYKRYNFVDDRLTDLVTTFWADHELLLSEMGDAVHNRKIGAMKRKWLTACLGDELADQEIRSNYMDASGDSDAEDWTDLFSRRYDEFKKINRDKLDTYEPIPELLFSIADVFENPRSYTRPGSKRIPRVRIR